MKIRDHVLNICYCLKDCIMILYCLLLYGQELTYLCINPYFLLLRQGVLAEARRIRIQKNQLNACLVCTNEAQIDQYRDDLDKELSKIKVPDEVMNCHQINCFDESHFHQIDEFGEEILKCLESKKCISRVRKKKTIPKWNEVAKPAKEKTLFWHNIWLSCGRPNVGVVCNIRRRTRAIYHKLAI